MATLCNTAQTVGGWPELKVDETQLHTDNYDISQNAKIDLDFAYVFLKQRLDEIRNFGRASKNNQPTEEEIASLDKFVRNDETKTMSINEIIPVEWYNNMIDLLDNYPNKMRDDGIVEIGDYQITNGDKIESEKFKQLIIYLNNMKLRGGACHSCNAGEGGGCSEGYCQSHCGMGYT